MTLTVTTVPAVAEEAEAEALPPVPPFTVTVYSAGGSSFQVAFTVTFPVTVTLSPGANCVPPMSHTSNCCPAGAVKPQEGRMKLSPWLTVWDAMLPPPPFASKAAV